MRILQLRALPNPNPSQIKVLLSGPADELVVKIWTPALRLVYRSRLADVAAGWQSLPLEGPAWAALPAGLFFYTVEARRGSYPTLAVKPGRLVRIR